MRTIMGLRRIAPPAALTGLVALAALAVGVPAGQGADPFVAGGPSTRTVALPASQADQAKTRGRELAAALGLPGLTQSAERLDDRFEHRTYDEVTSFDAAGKEVAITRFETDGTVAMALVLGWQPGHAGHVDPATAERRARAFARAAGLAVDGQPSVEASAGSGGWSIAWPRIVSATPVRGDGLRISLWPDGTFHGLTRIERPLAALPDRQISADEARQAATIWAGAHFPSSDGGMRVAAVERAWVAPNGMFSRNGLDAPAATLRLAWIVRFETGGRLSERLRSVEVWLDAGDGNALGGDVIE
jgi:hypothetical protein